MTARHASERGLTLTELTIAMVIAAMVVMGIVGFYINSQSLWFDASTQAITQREGSLVLESIGRQARMANRAYVGIPAAGDSTRMQLQLIIPDALGVHSYYYWWDADSLIHEGFDPVANDSGPVLQQSHVERFVVSADSAMVTIRDLQIVSSQGQRVNFSTSFAMRNR